MGTTEQPEIVKPEAIVAVAIPEPDVRLGSLAVSNPAELVKQASALATVLAEIINKQELYSIIKNKKTGDRRKYVRCEGWTTMGAMLGVVPVEDYCRPLPDKKGFEAKINIIRVRDGGIVGSASAECTHDENLWKNRDSYSLRSMALTRATSKAFRLSFSWIIKLAGFETTPAEEMVADEDSQITRQTVEDEVERQKKGSEPTPIKESLKTPTEAPKVLFWTAPEQFNGHRAIFINLKEYGSALNEVAAEGLKQILKNYCKYGSDGDLWVPTGKKPHEMDSLIAELEKCGVKTKQLASRNA